jgi:hypothetical protein
MSTRGARKNSLSVKFRRNSTKCLSILELTKLRKDSEIQVSKGKILSFGRRRDEISSGGAEVLHDRRIWRRDRMLILRALQTSWVRRIGYIRHIGGEFPEVPKSQVSTLEDSTCGVEKLLNSRREE